MGAASKRPPGRYQFVCSSRAVGVVKVRVYGWARRRPLSAVALVSIVTSYFVASGSRFAGVKIRMVVPDQRNVPFTAGLILKNAGRSRSGMRPSATIGSEKTMRISFASSIEAISPVGPALTMRSGEGDGAGGCARATEAETRNRTAAKARRRVIGVSVMLLVKLDTGCQ